MPSDEQTRSAFPNPGDVIDGRYRVEGQLGRGGAGTVYKVMQVGVEIPRALKLLSPEEGKQLDLFTKTFAQEIRILSELTHKNVVKIIDASAENKPARLTAAPGMPASERMIDNRYFVMEYVSGGTLAEVFQREALTRLEILALFADVLEGITYLHSRDVLHLDIKPQNIVVQKFSSERTRSYEPKISDLGVAKVLDRAPLQMTRQSDETYVFGTATFLPGYARDIIESGEPIRRSELRSWIPHVDLFCAGGTFTAALTSLKVLSIEHQYKELLASPASAVRKQFDSDDWNYLRAFIERLLAPRGSGYASAEEARDALLRIDPRRAVTMHVPDLTTIGSEHRIVLDNRVVRLTERAHNVVSHPMFQRLRRLNQLNFVELIYPGARHSRLSHSLQAFELAKRVVEHLLANRQFRLNATAADIDAFLISALCHDVGHYPLTHAIEDLRTGPGLGVKADFQMLEHFLKRGTPSIADVIKKEWGVTVETILALAAKAIPAKPLNDIQKILRLLLDGPIDIDKLAYLVDDSRHSGVSYGSGIDVDALIGALTIIETPKGLQLALEHKGVSPAESVVAARYHMFARVYWHHTNRAIMAMLRYVFERVLSARDDEGTLRYPFDQYINDTIGYGDLEAARLVASKYDEFFPGQGNPLKDFLGGERSIYKRLVSFSAHPKNDDISSCHRFLMQDKELGKTVAECRAELEKAVGVPVTPDRLLVDIPQLDKERDTRRVVDLPVVDARTREIIPLSDFSQASEGVYRDFETLVKKSRFFIHPQTRQSIAERGLETKAAEAVESHILGKAQSAV
jgi:uncharacterized protein